MRARQPARQTRTDRGSGRARGLLLLAAVGVGALVVTLLVSAAEPAPAQAWILGLPSPGQVIGGLLGGIGHVIGGTVGKLAVTAFDAIIHALFAPIAHFINTQLIGWLVAVPDYAPPGSHVAATERTVLAMAGAALGAVATISIARFWVAGIAGSGGSALEGLARTVGAALLLPVWPWVFHTAVALANEASTGLLGSGSVTKSSANLLAVGVGAGVGLGFLGVGLFVSIVMAVVASILFLGLLMMKVVRGDLDGAGVHRDADRDRALAGDLVDPARARARVLGVPGGAAGVGDLLCGERGAAQRRAVPERVLGVLRRAAGAAGGDRAAVADADVADAGWRRWRCSARARSAAGSCRARSATPRARSCAMSRASTSRAGPEAMAGGAGQRGKETDSRLGARLRAESVLAASKAAATGGAAVGRSRPARRPAPHRAGEPADQSARPRGSTEHQAGWVGRLRGSGNPRAYSPPPLAGADGGVAAAGGGAAAAELAPGGLRRRDARGVAARATPAGVGRAGQERARLAGAGDAGGGGEPDRRPGPAGPAASGLPGARGVDAAGARGDPDAGRGEPRGQGAGIRRRRRVDGRDSARAPSRPPARRCPVAAAAQPRRRPPPAAGAGRGEQRWDAVARAAGPATTDGRGRLVNPAPAHLEAKLRFGWDFTVGQIAAMIGGILVGFAWANWLSPIHGIGAAVTGVYVGGLPVVAGFVASQTEFDLWAVVLAALRWRRAEGRFLPGAGPADRIRRRCSTTTSESAATASSACSIPTCCGARHDPGQR